MAGKVFLLDDDADLRSAITQSLEIEGYDVSDFSTGEEMLSALSAQFEGCLVTDIRMPGLDGITVMERALDIDPAMPVVLITGHGDVPIAVEAMKRGAYDFIEKPFSTATLLGVLDHALEKRRLVLENRALREALDGERDFLEARLVGRTPQMVDLRHKIRALAGLDTDILLFGETGSGKDVIAHLIHDLSERAKAPYVAINCGALPAHIIESELFGHEPGAFTGAQKMRVGKLEYANGGTIFLDEIESMPLDLQVKLLRAIEARTVERLGSNKPIPLDVRFIAATKADLAKEAEAGRFRADLYYRLNVVTLPIPPLRSRKHDIPVLFAHLAREARSKFRREIPDVPEGVMARLMAHEWPGNVRELRNVVDRFVMGLGLPEAFYPAPLSVGGGMETADLVARVEAYERDVIAAAIKSARSLKEVYESLGISRKTLYDKMRRYGLSKEGE